MSRQVNWPSRLKDDVSKQNKGLTSSASVPALPVSVDVSQTAGQTGMKGISITKLPLDKILPGSTGTLSKSASSKKLFVKCHPTHDYDFEIRSSSTAEFVAAEKRPKSAAAPLRFTGASGLNITPRSRYAHIAQTARTLLADVSDTQLSISHTAVVENARQAVAVRLATRGRSQQHSSNALLQSSASKLHKNQPKFNKQEIIGNIREIQRVAELWRNDRSGTSPMLLQVMTDAPVTKKPKRRVVQQKPKQFTSTKLIKDRVNERVEEYRTNPQERFKLMKRVEEAKTGQNKSCELVVHNKKLARMYNKEFQASIAASTLHEEQQRRRKLAEKREAIMQDKARQHAQLEARVLHKFSEEGVEARERLKKSTHRVTIVTKKWMVLVSLIPRALWLGYRIQQIQKARVEASTAAWFTDAFKASYRLYTAQRVQDHRKHASHVVMRALRHWVAQQRKKRRARAAEYIYECITLLRSLHTMRLSLQRTEFKTSVSKVQAYWRKRVANEEAKMVTLAHTWMRVETSITRAKEKKKSKKEKKKKGGKKGKDKKSKKAGKDKEEKTEVVEDVSTGLEQFRFPACLASFPLDNICLTEPFSQQQRCVLVKMVYDHRLSTFRYHYHQYSKQLSAFLQTHHEKVEKAKATLHKEVRTKEELSHITMAQILQTANLKFPPAPKFYWNVTDKGMRKYVFAAAQYLNIVGAKPAAKAHAHGHKKGKKGKKGAATAAVTTTSDVDDPEPESDEDSDLGQVNEDVDIGRWSKYSNTAILRPDALLSVVLGAVAQKLESSAASLVKTKKSPKKHKKAKKKKTAGAGQGAGAEGEDEDSEGDGDGEDAGELDKEEDEDDEEDEEDEDEDDA
mmetsp:Transcript_4036/g.7766  ORF Transcript_4036/g.7766 Transcript_4036/m.7766 type:complete len:853 (+) Transcript_4036:24-2582(+)